MSKAQAKGNVKTTAPPAPAKSGFDAKAFAKNGVSEEAVVAIKAAFDLFDTDQGGSVDIKGILTFI
jgi:hypothetical protein